MSDSAVARGNLRDLLKQSIQDATRSSTSRDAEHLLLCDFLACVIGSEPDDAPRGWTNDGTAGAVAALAGRAHARDQDDIHWPTAVHPGSIVWPVVVALGAEVVATGDLAAEAARIGYQSMISLARLLGPIHAQSWHATATCGVLGAAVTAATLLGLEEEQRLWACGHAVSVAGGVGQALVERSGTSRFHRIASSVLGIQAARLAQAGVPSSVQVLEGERGVLAVLAPAFETRLSIRAGAALDETSVRIFPVNGFTQSAVAITAELRARSQSDAISFIVDVPAVVAAATTGMTGGQWWDLRAAVAAAWTTGDPFRLESSEESVLLRERISVVGGALPPGVTRVTVQTAHGSLTKKSETPQGLSVLDPGVAPMLDRKWQLLVARGAGGAEYVRRLSMEMLSRGPRPDDLSTLLSA